MDLPESSSSLMKTKGKSLLAFQKLGNPSLQNKTWPETSNHYIRGIWIFIPFLSHYGNQENANFPKAISETFPQVYQLYEKSENFYTLFAYFCFHFACFPSSKDWISFWRNWRKNALAFRKNLFQVYDYYFF